VPDFRSPEYAEALEKATLQRRAGAYCGGWARR
jgi:hypothetical protein